MKRQFGRRSFYLTVLGAFTALLFTGTDAPAQRLYNLDWAERFNDSAGNETEDNWVANSYTAASGATHIVSISFPINDAFTDQKISGLIYQGFDLNDPTAGGGLILLSQTDTTFTSTRGDIVTITLKTPVDLNVGDFFYAAVLIPGVPSNKFPFANDTAGAGLMTQPLGRSFFDVGLTFGGPYDINQLPANSANITVFGGVHPVMMGAPGDVQSPGNLALWVKATPQ
jgi:hypothetical protein